MHSIININMIVLELCNIINIAIIAVVFQSMMPKVTLVHLTFIQYHMSNLFHFFKSHDHQQQLFHNVTAHLHPPDTCHSVFIFIVPGSRQGRGLYLEGLLAHPASPVSESQPFPMQVPILASLSLSTPLTGVLLHKNPGT